MLLQPSVLLLAFSPNETLALAAAAAVVLGAVVALVVRARRKRSLGSPPPPALPEKKALKARLPSPAKEAEALPRRAKAPLTEVAKTPSELSNKAEEEKRKEAYRARKEALLLEREARLKERLEEERRGREAAEERRLRDEKEAQQKTAEERAREREEAQRKALLEEEKEAALSEARRREREAEEEIKREAYRQKKEADRLEREARLKEREEALKKAEEEAQALAKAALLAKAREEEEQKKKEAAQAGKTLAAGLEKTRVGFMARLNALFSGGKLVDDAVLADLEEVLFTADIGVRTATRLLESAREKVKKKELKDPERLKEVLRQEIAEILSLSDKAPGPKGALDVGANRPFVVMVVGVNGSGKTTTVGKLAQKMKDAGHTVLLGAGDTFRAAAGEQLEIWADRVGAPIVRGKEGSDPAAVCFEAVQEAVKTGVEVVLCDTAGRLHTKTPLMEELKKVKRVIGKAASGAPHEVLLVLDATNGQNAIAQARQFHDALGITGIALTKLDGTAKGGVIIGICDELKIPVRYVGVGETANDLKAFSPAEFVEALFQ